MTENFVVDSVCRALVEDGYTIVQRALATQQGFDIVAQKNGGVLVIEAKGGRKLKTWHCTLRAHVHVWSGL
jgi:Holliday junction resolvase-like predicted endonuclease